jgi:hypothetical protein
VNSVIFRRLSEHLSKQNWFAVGLDLTVVVVGIYIGLQADAWMSAKQDRDLEVEYLERLLSDMEESIAAQRSGIKIFDDGTASIDYIAEVQKSGTSDGLDEERLILGLNNVGWVAPPATNMVTIRELQSTGNISLIRDLSVRMAIGQFDRSYANVTFSASQNLGFMAAGSPEVMTWSFMAPNVPGTHKSVAESEDDSYGYTHQYDIDRILKNPDAANITSWISGWSKYHGAVLMQHHEDTIAFRDLLGEKLSTLR